jgi:peroxiredoxin
MARTPSNMLPLGTPMPDVTLPDVSGEPHRLQQYAGEQGVLVMFICNHCPFVLHVAPFLEELCQELNLMGIQCIAISSNDVEAYPDDAPDKMALFAQKYQLAFPYLYDETQEVAKAFDAACTPDFFLFDKELKLAYRGQMDGSRPGNGIPVSGLDLITAAEQMSRGEQPPPENQKPSLGCNIKWKKQSAPA